jgi:phosphonate degradation associated HDIG domain protein
MPEPDARVDEVFQLMQQRGVEAYVGEPVSQLEHALQAAFFATQCDSKPTLVVAALLHDVGHLLHNLPEDIADHGVDTRHEENGYRWLLSRFGPGVAEPTRLHVAAKRYLCSTDPCYFAQLSPASVQSLALQGGPFTAEEAREFEKNTWYSDAVELRRWDDAAKIPKLSVPGLESYREMLAVQRIPRSTETTT